MVGFDLIFDHHILHFVIHSVLSCVQSAWWLTTNHLSNCCERDPGEMFLAQHEIQLNYENDRWLARIQLPNLKHSNRIGAKTTNWIPIASCHVKSLHCWISPKVRRSRFKSRSWFVFAHHHAYLCVNCAVTSCSLFYIPHVTLVIMTSTIPLSIGMNIVGYWQ